MRTIASIFFSLLVCSSAITTQGQAASHAVGNETRGLRSAIAQDDECFFVIQESGEIHMHGSKSTIGFSPKYPIPEGIQATSISSGAQHAMALTSSGEVVAWGSNEFGECDVPHGLKAVQVQAGDWYSLALDTKGRVRAWGSNAFNRCSVPSGLIAESISAGPHHAMAINRDGYVVSWGGWDSESLERTRSIVEGLSAFMPPQEARQAISKALREHKELGFQHVLDVPKGLKAKFVVAGPDFSAAVRPDGKIVAWGTGNPFADFPRLNSPVKSIYTGAFMDSMVCVLLEDGTVLAKGQGYSVWTEWAFQVTDLSVERGRAVAIDTDGQLRVVGCWTWPPVQSWDTDPCDIPEGLKPLILSRLNQE